MHFTRDPIVETVLTARDGYKFNLTHMSNGKEYSTTVVQIVSIGNVVCYCSVDQVDSFLLPLAEYQLVEVKEAKLPLKMPSEKTSDSGRFNKPSRKRRKKPYKAEKEESPQQPQKKDDENQKFSAKMIPPPSNLVVDVLKERLSTIGDNIEMLKKEPIEET